MTIPPPEPSNPYEAPKYQPPGSSTPPPASPYDAQPPTSSQPPLTPPPPPAYGTPYGAVPPPKGGNNGLAIASMSTGIGSIVLVCCCAFFSIAAGIGAIVMGVMANKQIQQTGQQGKGMALAGMITGGVGVLIGIISMIVGVAMNPDVFSRFN